MNKVHIRKGDNVIVIAGADKGKTGKVLEVLKKEDRVIVEGRNIVSRSTKPSAKTPNGGIIQKEAPIHISNVRDVDGSFLLDDASVGGLSRRLGAPGYYVSAFYDDAVLFLEHLEHLSGLAFVGTGDDDDVVAFSDMHLVHYLILF